MNALIWLLVILRMPTAKICPLTPERELSNLTITEAMVEVKKEDDYPPADWVVSGCGCELIQRGPYWALHVWARRINPEEMWRKTIRMREDETRIRKDCMEWLGEMEKRRKRQHGQDK